MNSKRYKTLVIFLLLAHCGFSQNYSFNFFSTGRRVCLVSSEAILTENKIKIVIHDSSSNNSEPLYINRRALGTYTWSNVATALPAGTGHWFDTNVSAGDVWEYQIRRQNTWNYQSVSYDAIGYTIGSLLSDNSNYKGQIILLVSNEIPINLASKYTRLKKEITADGWYVNELIVNRASNWDSGNEVVAIRNQIANLYNNSAQNDKPKALFILGHVPLPRSGSADVVAPDDHSQNKGARGCDAYYADIDGIFTDTASYNPGGLSSNLAINLPGDFKWDQDFIPSNLEMAFGRIDFANLTDVTTAEQTLLEAYLDRLSNNKNVVDGFDMGEKSAFNIGYDNSNDGSYRSLINISRPDQVFENTTGSNHNQWVQNNGPFKIYMQNRVAPEISDWLSYGMNSTVYSSDQSYWGFGDVPQPSGVYSRIRAILGVDSKCLVALWTTTGINIFHQACTGMPLGIAMKEIMNHNATNLILEKAPQAYDTQDWWNRSHFAYFGDPTLNLYQVAPPSNLSIVTSDNSAQMQWTNSVDPDVIGYHIYQSSSEFGVFERITTSPVNSNSYTIPNYQQGNWYMVKAIKVITSGCGKFLHSSLGIDLQGTIALNSSSILKSPTMSVFPIPTKGIVNVQSSEFAESAELYTVIGQKVYSIQNVNQKQFQLDISHLPDNLYLLRITTKFGEPQLLKIIKEN
jgi:hypothetical protein